MQLSVTLIEQIPPPHSFGSSTAGDFQEKIEYSFVQDSISIAALERELTGRLLRSFPAL